MSEFNEFILSSVCYKVINNNNYYTMSGKLNLTDLLATLPQQQAPKFVDTLLKDKSKKINVLSRKQEELMRRESNYEMTK